MDQHANISMPNERFITNTLKWLKVRNEKLSQRYFTSRRRFQHIAITKQQPDASSNAEILLRAVQC